MTRWVAWRANDRSRFRKAHAVTATGVNIRNGSFPLACGRWAPDGFDAEIRIDHGAPRCASCIRATEKMD